MVGKRICIIGAGPAGCSAIIHFKTFAEQGDTVPEVVCYEKQSNWGGLWNFTWQTGLDEFGDKVCCSMYRNLWSNMPKDALEYGDYTFHEHFNQPTSGFPPRTAIFDYLEGRWNKYNIRKHITFNHPIQRVTYDVKTQLFTVLVKDRLNDITKLEKFDFVLVCSGHYSTPQLPDIPDLLEFPGRVIHAHDFRDASEFAGQRVLIIGSSFSAEDLALQTRKFGAKEVIVSYRNIPMNYKWPSKISEHPQIVRIEEKIVTFNDGYSCEVDAIIAATGYQFDNWYMADNLRLTGQNVAYNENCYKGIVWQPAANNQLFYIGFQQQFYSFTLNDVETYFAAQVILGHLTLPSAAEMDSDWRKWRARSDYLNHDYHLYVDFQTEYLEDLRKMSGYMYPIDCARHFHAWENDRRHDLATYRDQTHYKSIHDGTPTVAHNKPWMQAKDDSIPAFLGYRFRKRHSQ